MKFILQIKHTGDFVSENRILKKVGMVLLVMVIVPSLFYTASEINAYNENEELLSQVYKQQLDVILFSVNQYSWDYINSWTSKLDMIIKGELLVIDKSGVVNKNDENLRRFIMDNKIFKQVTFYDLSFNKIFSVSTLNTLEEEIYNEQKDYIEKNLEDLKRLPSLKEKDYRKIEPFIYNSPLLTDFVGMAYVSEFKNQVVYAMITMDSDVFITNAISKKLFELAGANLACAVFDEKTKSAKASTQTLAYDDALVREKLWIFPDHSLGIGFSGLSLGQFAQQRMIKSILLILGVNLILIAGVWFVYKNTRKEMQLAQLKSDFVSNVSHELRTPLSLIRMYSETLELGRIRDEEKKNQYYKNISQEAERLTHLINNILNFSRLESGRKEYNFTKVALNNLVEKVLETYGDSIREQGFNLNKELSAIDILIDADEAAVSENLINLIDNALKYSDNEKYIKISTKLQKDSAMLIVEDHGAGIAHENQHKIFEKFYRESNALIHNTKGSGLGLTLVKYNMQAHKGDVKLESTPGKGSRFTLIFPINRSENA
ncbi:MAG: HAMP domain-containing histidine kinase [Calditrichae bacterium]|nr:HAMP domain-containing histidine kinase [Calditrichota bacterium]MCB9058853.1 HAMP domain-containing histidine kinase [Calditrichia bacterium]